MKARMIIWIDATSDLHEGHHEWNKCLQDLEDSWSIDTGDFKTLSFS